MSDYAIHGTYLLDFTCFDPNKCSLTKCWHKHDPCMVRYWMLLACMTILLICPTRKSKFIFWFFVGQINCIFLMLRANPEPFSQSLESRSKCCIRSCSALVTNPSGGAPTGAGSAGGAFGEAQLESFACGGAGAGGAAGRAGGTAGTAGGPAFGATSDGELPCNEPGVPSDDDCFSVGAGPGRTVAWCLKVSWLHWQRPFSPTFHT